MKQRRAYSVLPASESEYVLASSSASVTRLTNVNNYI